MSSRRRALFLVDGVEGSRCADFSGISNSLQLSFSTPIACTFFFHYSHSTCSVGGRSVLGLEQLNSAGKVFCSLPRSLACLCCSNSVSRTLLRRFALPRFGRQMLGTGENQIQPSSTVVLFSTLFPVSKPFLTDWLLFPAHAPYFCAHSTPSRVCFGAVCEKNTAVEMLCKVLPLLCWWLHHQTALFRLPPAPLEAHHNQLQKYLRHVFWHKWPVHDLVLVIPPPPLIKVASNTRPYSKLGGTTLNGRGEGVSIIFYRPVTRSDLKQERSFFRGSVPSFLQVVAATSSLPFSADSATQPQWGTSIRVQPSLARPGCSNVLRKCLFGQST